MAILSAIVLYALVFWFAVSARVQTIVGHYLGTGLNLLIGGSLIARVYIRRFAFYLGLFVLADLALLIIAAGINYKPFLYVVLVGNSLLLFAASYTALIAGNAVNATAGRIVQFGKTLASFSVLFLPIKLIGLCIETIGHVGHVVADRLRGMARALFYVTSLMFVLSALTLLDAQLGWNMVNWVTLSLISFVGLSTAGLLSSRHLDSHGIATQVLFFVALLLSVASGVVYSVGWVEFTQFIVVYATYWPIPVCAIAVYLFVAAICDTHWGEGSESHSHEDRMRPWKKTTLNVAGIATVLFVIYPFLTRENPSWFWTQRLVHFQFGRLHSVNTGQAQDETEGTVAAAEKTRRLPNDLSVIDASFYPSADRAYTLETKEKAWADRAAGRSINHPVQAVPGYLNGWMDAFAQHEPTLVVFGHEQICSGSNPSECTSAAGSTKADKQYRTALQDPAEGGSSTAAAGRYRAIIARVRTDSGYLYRPIETGFAAAVCEPGTVQMRTNVWTFYGPIKTSQDTAGNTNGITFSKSVGDPLAVQTCKAHPGQAIVPIDPAAVRQ